MKNCLHEFRKVVNIIADLPYNQFKLDKKAIRSKDVIICGVSWETSIFYCAKCGAVILPLEKGLK